MAPHCLVLGFSDVNSSWSCRHFGNNLTWMLMTMQSLIIHLLSSPYTQFLARLWRQVVNFWQTHPAPSCGMSAQILHTSSLWRSCQASWSPCCTYSNHLWRYWLIWACPSHLVGYWLASHHSQCRMPVSIVLTYVSTSSMCLGHSKKTNVRHPTAAAKWCTLRQGDMWMVRLKINIT